MGNFKKKTFTVTEKNFSDRALSLFKYQSNANEVYKKYLQLLKINPEKIKQIDEIPFLPVEFFKNYRVVSAPSNLDNKKNPKGQLFISSGTTGMIKSRHWVKDISIYQKSIYESFKIFYGNPKKYCIIACIPKRKNSSLVFMTEYLINKSNHTLSGFYYQQEKKLNQTLNKLKSEKKKVLLIGVSYALLDLSEKKIEFPDDIIIMETGGMKGKRKELTRIEFHNILTKNFSKKKIHSEYGMTELLSQSYSQGNGVFHSPPWMKIVVRDPHDPFTQIGHHQTGAINIIDLANIDSCSFIATDDLGKTLSDTSFEVLGRMEYTDIRGCNLLIE